jgi:hypothetical protein
MGKHSEKSSDFVSGGKKTFWFRGSIIASLPAPEG